MSFSAGGLGVPLTNNPGSSSTVVQNYHPDRWFRTRNLTLELIMGYWSGEINFRNSHSNLEKVNPIRQKRSDHLDFQVQSTF